MIVDACGNPYEFLITDGTTHDVKVVPELLDKESLKTTKYVSADKGYDSDHLREIITKQSAKAVIPKK